MDPVLKSALTSVATAVVGAATAWAVTHGYLTKDQATSLTTYLVGSGSILIGAALVWYKARQHTQAAMIKAVNSAPNGVTVVPTTAAKQAAIPPANGPLK